MKNRNRQQEARSSSPRDQTTVACAAASDTVCPALTIHGTTGLARARAFSHSQGLQSPIDTSDEENQAPALRLPLTSAPAQSPSQGVQLPAQTSNDKSQESLALFDAPSEHSFIEDDDNEDEAALNYQSNQENVLSSKNLQVTRRVTRSQIRAKQDTAIGSKTPRAATTMAGNTFQQAGTKAVASNKGGKQTATNKTPATPTAQKSAATKKGDSTSSNGAGDGRDDEDERSNCGGRKPPPSKNGLMDQPSDSDEDENDNNTMIVHEGRDSDFNSLFCEDENSDLALILRQSVDDNDPVASHAVAGAVENATTPYHDVTTHPLYAQVIALRDSAASRKDSLTEGMSALSINAQTIQNQEKTLNSIVNGLRETRLDLCETRALIKADNEEIKRRTEAIQNDQALDGRIADMLETLIVGPDQDMRGRANLKRGRETFSDDEDESDRNRRRFRRSQDGYNAMETELSTLTTLQRQIAAAREGPRGSRRTRMAIKEPGYDEDTDTSGSGVDITGYLPKERREADAAAKREAPPAPRPPPAPLRAPRQTSHLISAPPPPSAGTHAVATRREQIRVARIAEAARRAAEDPYSKLTAAPGFIRPTPARASVSPSPPLNTSAQTPDSHYASQAQPERRSGRRKKTTMQKHLFG